MKHRTKYIVIFSILLIIGIMSIDLLEPNKEQQVKGNIELLVSDNSYDYLVECAKNFMKQNEKAIINIKKLENYNQIIDYKAEGSNKIKLTDIVQIDRFNFDTLRLDDKKYFNGSNKLLSDYAKNFSKYRISQVKYGGNNSIGIPLTSRPLAFYIREDMLNKYGYKRESMNTWEDVIRIGKDVYTKSNGRVKIINATGQDYEDLLDLLIMESLADSENMESIKLEVQTMIKNLKDNNILNLQDGGEFLARISSINAMREIITLDEPCEWSCDNVPSIKPGGNKFFGSEGDNLLVLNQNVDNEKLVEKFITYIITNNDEAIKYVEEGRFFSSYLSTYRSKEIEKSVKNFVGKNPLVILSNVEEKAPEINDYDKYIKIKQELRE